MIIKYRLTIKYVHVISPVVIKCDAFGLTTDNQIVIHEPGDNSDTFSYVYLKEIKSFKVEVIANLPSASKSKQWL